jgi:uncharacterized protein GlcG (DUF336 family)
MITAFSALLVLAAVGYVLTSRWHGRPINPRRLLLMPAVLSGYGLLQFTGAAGRGLRAVDVVVIAAGAAVAALMGLARAVTVAVYVRDGQPWMRYRPATLALWAATLATRLAVTAISIAIGSSAGATRWPAILLSVGVTLLAEGIVVTRRGFSPDGQQWQARSRRQTLAAR